MSRYQMPRRFAAGADLITTQPARAEAGGCGMDGE